MDLPPLCVDDAPYTWRQRASRGSDKEKVLLSWKTKPDPLISLQGKKSAPSWCAHRAEVFRMPSLSVLRHQADLPTTMGRGSEEPSRDLLQAPIWQVHPLALAPPTLPTEHFPAKLEGTTLSPPGLQGPVHWQGTTVEEMVWKEVLVAAVEAEREAERGNLSSLCLLQAQHILHPKAPWIARHPHSASAL